MQLINLKKCCSYICHVRHLVSILFFSLLVACSDSTEKTTPKAANIPAGEIVLAADSPKRAYIKTTQLMLSSRPLLPPLAGKTTLDENLTSRISSPVAGRVISPPAALGKFIKAGEPLLEIDSPEVAAAESDHAKAQADLTLAIKMYNRQQKLYAGKAISRKELEQSQDNLTLARSEAGRAQEKLRNLRIDPRQNDGRFKLRSPISGIILERHVNLGMEVRPDLPDPLYVISDIGKLSLLMEVFEVSLAKIKIGQQVSVTVPAYPDERFPATVKYIGQELDETTRTILVRCELPNPEGRLLPGMYATVDVQSGPSDQAIVIPLTAVFTEDESDYVFIELDNHHYKKLPVNLGLRLKDRAVVTSGLQPSQKLVSEGALLLRTEEDVEENTE